MIVLGSNLETLIITNWDNGNKNWNIDESYY